LTLHCSLKLVEAAFTVSFPSNSSESIIAYTLLDDHLLEVFEEVYINNIGKTFNPAAEDFDQRITSYWVGLGKRISQWVTDRLSSANEFLSKHYPILSANISLLSKAAHKSSNHSYDIPLYCPAFEAAITASCQKTASLFEYVRALLCCLIFQLISSRLSLKIGNLVEPEYTSCGPASNAHWPHRLRDASECLIRVLCPVIGLIDPTDVVNYYFFISFSPFLTQGF